MMHRTTACTAYAKPGAAERNMINSGAGIAPGEADVGLMKMRILPILAVCMVAAGCQSPHPRQTSSNQNSAQPKIKTWTTAIATYYDTNGDSQPDKWVRGDRLYLDRNFDGKIDYEKDLTSSDWVNESVDSDYDGYYDKRTSGGGAAGRFDVEEIKEEVPWFPTPNGLN